MADQVVRFRWLSAGNTQARREADNTGAGFERLGKSLNVLPALLTGLAIGLPSRALVKFAAEGLESVDALAKLSRGLGVATEELAAFDRAAQLSGTSQEAIVKAMERAAKSLGDAQVGLSTAKIGFEALDSFGLTITSPPYANRYD